MPVVWFVSDTLDSETIIYVASDEEKALRKIASYLSVYNVDLLDTTVYPFPVDQEIENTIFVDIPNSISFNFWLNDKYEHEKDENRNLTAAATEWPVEFLQIGQYYRVRVTKQELEAKYVGLQDSDSQWEWLRNYAQQKLRTLLESPDKNQLLIKI